MNKNIEPKHYTEMVISPLEYNVKNNIPWCEANAIKYISRWKSKNGVEDLKKAVWYINYLIEQEEEKYEKKIIH